MNKIIEKKVEILIEKINIDETKNVEIIFIIEDKTSTINFGLIERKSNLNEFYKIFLILLLKKKINKILIKSNYIDMPENFKNEFKEEEIIFKIINLFLNDLIKDSNEILDHYYETQNILKEEIKKQNNLEIKKIK